MMPRSARNTMVCLLLLTFATAVMFGVTVKARAPQMGKLPITLAGWMTGGTNVYAANWYREGAFKLWFGLYWTPASIETPQEARRTYVSFPPGSVLPIHLLATCLRRPPTPSLIQSYGLFNQFLVAVVLSFLVFLALRRMDYAHGPSTLFAAVPAVLYLWFPACYYQHQVGFFSDQAVPLLFALYVLIELLRLDMPESGVRNTLGLIQGFLAFYGVLTDWLFVFVLFAAGLRRLLAGEFGRTPRIFLRRTAFFTLPMIAAVALFAIQLHHLGAFDELQQRFIQRTGLGHAQNPDAVKKSDAAPKPLDYQKFVRFPLDSFFWTRHIPAAFGVAGKPVLLICFGLFIALASTLLTLRFQAAPAPPNLRYAFLAALLLLLPCFAYLYVFKEHSSYWLHSFSTLKFALPLAVLPLAVFPAAAVRAVPWRPAHWIAAVLCLGLACAYALALSGMNKDAFNTTLTDFAETGGFLGAHTGYSDVVITTETPINDQPPQYIAYSMKTVHRVTSMNEIRALVAQIKTEYTVCLFSRNKQSSPKVPGVELLADKAYETFTSGSMELRKIHKADFEAIALP